MRSEGLDRGTWLAFWLTVLGNSVDFFSVFFVCNSDHCILIKTSRVRGKKKSNLTPYLFLHSRAEKATSSEPKFHFLFSTLFPYELLNLERTQTFTYTRRLTPHYGSS